MYSMLVITAVGENAPPTVTLDVPPPAFGNVVTNPPPVKSLLNVPAFALYKSIGCAVLNPVKPSSPSWRVPVWSPLFSSRSRTM